MKTGFEIIGSNYQEIPLHLSVRDGSLSMVALSLLALSFLIISFSRLSSKQMIYSMVKAVYKNKQIERIVQVDYPLNNMSSILLAINYIVSTAGLLYLTLQTAFSVQPVMVLYLMVIPLLMMILPWIASTYVGIVTGEHKIVVENKMNTIVFAHFTGILYSLILLVWAFNIQWSTIFIYTFLGIAIFMWFYRFLRGFVFAFGKGASWYYIILYFCTLEILPFMVFYQALNNKMEGKFNWLLN